MHPQVLVTYASKYGATKEIAGEIGDVISRAGLSVEILPVDGVTDLGSYHAVILGSAVYAGQWRKEAAAFLESHEDELADKPAWLFSSGPTGEGEPEDLMKGWRFPEELQPIADRILPRDVALFHGALDTSKLNLAERLIVRGIKAPVGDFRDWDAIRSWANSIAEKLKTEASQS